MYISTCTSNSETETSCLIFWVKSHFEKTKRCPSANREIRQFFSPNDLDSDFYAFLLEKYSPVTTEYALYISVQKYSFLSKENSQ